MTALIANFTGADNTNVLTSYTTDSGDTLISVYTSASGVPKISGNRLWSNGGNWLRANTNSASADGAVEAVVCRVASTSSESIGISVRTGGPSQSGASLTFSGYCLMHYGGNWHLYYAVSGGSFTEIGTAVSQTLTVGSDYKVKLEAVGSTIKYWTDDADGTYVLRATITDSHVTATGAPGLWVDNGGFGTTSTGYQIDSLHEVVAATAITMTGPTSGTTGSASTNFTVGADGTITGTVVVTPSDGGGGGTFTPMTVSISSSSATGTFTYTPASNGAKTISATNNGGLSNPSNITYTASTPSATAVTMTGPTSGTLGVASTNFTVGANGAITGTVVVTPSDGGGGGTFTPTTVSISSGTPTGTFTYTPASSGAKTISCTNNGSLSNPSNITYTAAAAATAVTMSGPSSGTNGTASTNFTVGADGTITGTVVVTPSDAGNGGTFTPTTVSISSGSPTGTFTYTPASTGAKTISVTNNGSLSNPSNITYTVSAASSAVTMTGPSAGVSGSASAVFTIGASGAISGTVVVTPSDGGGGGTFTPSTVSISTGSPTATFTYTAASTGSKTISVTNNGGMTNPSNITFVSYAASSLAAGSPSLTSCTTTTISLSCTAASSGTPAYTYQWYRSTAPDAVLGAHNLLTGATSLTLADSASLVADTPYFYTCRATDSLGAVADSLRIAGVLKSAPLVIGFIGDSITYGTGLSAGQSPPEQIVAILQKLYKHRTVTTVNQAHGGAKASDWVSGSSYLTTAKTAFASAGVTHVHVMLGANDAGPAALVSAATYKTQLQNIIADLNGAGYKVILSCCTFLTAGVSYGAGDVASVALTLAYRDVVASLIDGVNVLRGDTLSFNYFINAQSEYQGDLVHPTAAGALSLAQMWARAIDRALFSPDRPVPTKTVTCTFKNRSGTAQANLTGLKWQWSDIQGTVIDSGTGATTDASGVFSITVHSYLAAGGIGFLEVTNAAGVVNTTYVSFAGPAVVA